MPTPMISDNWPRFLLPIVRKEWPQKMESIDSPSFQFYSEETSKASSEYSQGIGDFGLVPEYNSSDAEGKGAAIEYDNFSQMYEATFTHKEYAKGVAIERKLWDDDQKGNIRRRAQGLGHSFGTTLATHQASLFVNAFSSSRLGPDGVSLVSTVHPNRPNDPGTLISNKGTSAFSYAAVKATLQAGKRMEDDRGNPLPVMYDTILLPIELGEQATEILEALGKPGTADNDANALRNIKVVVDPYLTDANDWFMIDSTMSKLHLLWFWRFRPEITLDPASDYNLVARYRGYMRYSFGWDDYRWIYGHQVA